MADQIFKKETNWDNDNNFVCEDEITVTITLNEYRNLVKKDAINDYAIEKEREKAREANNNADAYKAKLEELIEKLNGVEDGEEAD